MKAFFLLILAITLIVALAFGLAAAMVDKK